MLAPNRADRKPRGGQDEGKVAGPAPPRRQQRGRAGISGAEPRGGTEIRRPENAGPPAGARKQALPGAHMCRPRGGEMENSKNNPMHPNANWTWRRLRAGETKAPSVSGTKRPGSGARAG